MGEGSPLKPSFWYLDTAALITMSCSAALYEAVRAEVTRAPRKPVLMDTVLAELQQQAQRGDSTGRLAAFAQKRLTWLGLPETLEECDYKAALHIQEAIAGGQELDYPLQHFGEAAAIAHAQHVAPGAVAVLFSDDYGARIAGKARRMQTMGVHKLLVRSVQAGRLTADEVMKYTEQIKTQRRGPALTRTDIISCDLGKCGLP